MTALEELGYRPRAPVSSSQLADPAIRKQWLADKGLTVFSLWSSMRQMTREGGSFFRHLLGLKPKRAKHRRCVDDDTGLRLGVRRSLVGELPKGDLMTVGKA